MELNEDVCYKALRAHDRRFDGIFFTCVTSTNVYCRPICSALVPKKENCRFVASSIEAEKAGFRPCLRCRPELAPGKEDRGSLDAAQELARYIDETLLMDEALSTQAAKLGMSERHLRRSFVQAFGIEPRHYVASRRLLFAKQLLQDTQLPITDIAYSAGFGSRGRLTINMREKYGFTPERFRKEQKLKRKPQAVTLRTDYRPPFHWQALLEFLAPRATSLERIEHDTYYRTIGAYEVSVKNVPTKNHLLVTIPVELAKDAHRILWRVRHLFDLDANPLFVEDALNKDSLLAPIIARYPGLRAPGCWDEFEMLLRAILGQQVSVAGASTLMNRLVTHIGIDPTTMAASTPEQIALIGMPLKRAKTLWTVAEHVRSGTINLGERSPDIFYKQLVQVPGIGPWTGEYLKMRILRWPDAFPTGDLGLQKAVTPGKRLGEKQLSARSADWRPWRSYAAILLWKSLHNSGG